jgi:hypothetical protein
MNPQSGTRASMDANHPSLEDRELSTVVHDVLAETSFIDIHTHLFSPEFGGACLWGIDELLTYHYLEAELFRHADIRPEAYWSLPKPLQADLIWQTLFVENSPVSEATRGVIAVLDALKLDTKALNLTSARDFFRAQKLVDYIPRVLSLAGISSVVMTNDPLDPTEMDLWNRGFKTDPRFQAALRLDRILNDWQSHYERLAAGGYRVAADGTVVQEPPAAEWHQVAKFPRAHAEFMLVLPAEQRDKEAVLRETATQVLDGAEVGMARSIASKAKCWIDCAAGADHQGERNIRFAA